MLNRSYYLIKNILQNSKLNRMNLIKNKKLYNENRSKNKLQNNNLILKRKFSSFQPFMTNGGGDGNDIIYLAAVIVGLYLTFKQ